MLVNQTAIEPAQHRITRHSRDVRTNRLIPGWTATSALHRTNRGIGIFLNVPNVGSTRHITLVHRSGFLGEGSSQRPQECINQAIEGLGALEVDRVSSSRHAFSARHGHDRCQCHGGAWENGEVFFSCEK